LNIFTFSKAEKNPSKRSVFTLPEKQLSGLLNGYAFNLGFVMHLTASRWTSTG